MKVYGNRVLLLKINLFTFEKKSMGINDELND